MEYSTNFQFFYTVNSRGGSTSDLAATYGCKDSAVARRVIHTLVEVVHRCCKLRLRPRLDEDWLVLLDSIPDVQLLPSRTLITDHFIDTSIQ